MARGHRYKPQLVKKTRTNKNNETTPRHPYSSTAFEQLQEASKKLKNTGDNRALSIAWDDTEAVGMDSTMRRQNGLTEQERKETLYQAYMQDPWISSCIEVITKRLVSGGLVLEPLDTHPSQQEHDLLYSFFINNMADGDLGDDDDEGDWDAVQFIRSVGEDILIYGEAYAEIVRDSHGTPVKLHKIDCITMSYELAPNGKILKYNQQLTHSQEPVPFEPSEIIRWWLPSKRAAMVAESPIERLLNAIDTTQKMIQWTQSFFRKGSKPPYWIEMGENSDEGDGKRYLEFIKQNNTGVKNAGAPIVAYGGAKLHEYNKGVIDIDFEKGRNRAREEVLAVFATPPAMVSLIESGNIGGGTGESQDKSFMYNAVNPLRHLIFGPINRRVVRRGFGVLTYKVSSKYGDYRDELAVSKIQDTRLRNGMSTQNEEREATGKKAYDGYGDTPVFAVSKEVTPLEMLAELADTQRANNELDLEQKQVAVDAAKVQLDKAKNPPETPPQGQQPPDTAQPDTTPQHSKAPQNGSQTQQQQQDDEEDDEEDTKESTSPNF